jgi:transposase
MPWKASSVMEERLCFVARLLDGEAMTDVCREFGVSRKTGYKIFDRYKEHGLAALSDRSRRPVRYANQLPQQLESLIVRLMRARRDSNPRPPDSKSGAISRHRYASPAIVRQNPI